MPIVLDMSQPRPGESVSDFNDRPLFEAPIITKVLSRHAGSVLGKADPTVDLTTMATELEKFDDAFSSLSNAFHGQTFCKFVAHDVDLGCGVYDQTKSLIIKLMSCIVCLVRADHGGMCVKRTRDAFIFLFSGTYKMSL